MRSALSMMAASMLFIGSMVWTQAPITARAAPDAEVQIPGSAQSFRDCADCPEMISLPAGKFIMGVPPVEEVHERVPVRLQGHSLPQHEVTFAHSFAIGKYDVTRAEFESFVNETGYDTGNTCNAVVVDPGDGRWKFYPQSGISWRNPSIPQTDRDPVVCVNWEDANAYADWLSRKTGHTYRLPTEAEWEYAARAGSQTARFWGDDFQQACLYANVSDQTLANTVKTPGNALPQCSDGYAYTSPVGQFRPNAFGLYDMLGNVWQWTSDCWNKDYRGAPADGSAWLTGNCNLRIVRGASWGAAAWYIRSGFHVSDLHDIRSAGRGFRVVRAADDGAG